MQKRYPTSEQFIIMFFPGLVACVRFMRFGPRTPGQLETGQLCFTNKGYG